VFCWFCHVCKLTQHKQGGKNGLPRHQPGAFAGMIEGNAPFGNNFFRVFSETLRPLVPCRNGGGLELTCTPSPGATCRRHPARRSASSLGAGCARLHPADTRAPLVGTQGDRGGRHPQSPAGRRRATGRLGICGQIVSGLWAGRRGPSEQAARAAGRPPAATSGASLEWGLLPRTGSGHLLGGVAPTRADGCGCRPNTVCA